jgi:hypothetical protein
MMAELLSDDARKLLMQIVANEAREAIDVTTNAAKELLHHGLIAIQFDHRGSAGFGESERWVKVTDRGEAVVAKYYGRSPDER